MHVYILYNCLYPALIGLDPPHSFLATSFPCASWATLMSSLWPLKRCTESDLRLCIRSWLHPRRTWLVLKQLCSKQLDLRPLREKIKKKKVLNSASQPCDYFNHYNKICFIPTVLHLLGASWSHAHFCRAKPFLSNATRLFSHLTTDPVIAVIPKVQPSSAVHIYHDTSMGTNWDQKKNQPQNHQHNTPVGHEIRQKCHTECEKENWEQWREEREKKG